MLVAYPELGNHPGSDHSTATTFGIFDSVLNVSDATMAFVFDVYAELLEVFDSPYIHVGGDECPRTEWLTSSDAQQLARQRGLAGPDQLQHWFTAQLRTWLTERGRIMVGWDEICDDGPVPGAIVMAWRDARYGVAAAHAGHQVIQAPTSHTYFDYYPGDGEDEPYAIGGLVTTRQVYGFDPLAGVEPAARHQVIGVQGQVWTEYLPSFRRVEYVLFPRACALSEIGWSNDDDRSWDGVRAAADRAPVAAGCPRRELSSRGRSAALAARRLRCASPPPGAPGVGPDPPLVRSPPSYRWRVTGQVGGEGSGTAPRTPRAASGRPRWERHPTPARRTGTRRRRCRSTCTATSRWRTGPGRCGSAPARPPGHRGSARCASRW